MVFGRRSNVCNAGITPVGATPNTYALRGNFRLGIRHVYPTVKANTALRPNENASFG
jgi:hypothetical protein